MSEPILRQDDLDAWDVWWETAGVWAETDPHRRRVESACRVVERALAGSERPSVSWSAGKDSTALAHLVVVACGAKHVELMSEKDDLDFPGEEEYVRRYAAEWGARLRIVRPPVSPLEWVRERAAAGEMLAGDDIHGRAAGLSKACFYPVVEAADSAYDLVMLGLRSEESAIRRRLRRARGRSYTLRSRSGQRRALPIADWRGIDVYAYMHSRGIEPLPVYRCIGLMHRDEPWRLRKSWWLPGASLAYGQGCWLRRYYPSLHRKFLDMVPGAGLHS